MLSYSVNVFFRCPGLLAAHDKGEAERYLFVGTEGTWGNVTVVDGKSEWRLTVIGSNARLDMGAFDARAAVHRAMGRDDVPFELIAVRAVAPQPRPSPRTIARAASSSPAMPRMSCRRPAGSA